MDNNVNEPQNKKQNVFLNFTRPECMLEAQRTGKAHNIFIELLIFVLVFTIYSTISGIITSIPMMINIFNSEEFISLTESMVNGKVTDFDTIFESVMQIVSSIPSWIMLLTLFVTAIGIVTVILYCKLFEKRRPFTLGLTKKKVVSEYLLGLIAGLAAFSLAVLICCLTGAMKIEAVNKIAQPYMIVLFFVAFMIQGMSEEILCRGYLMVTLAKRNTLAVAIGISAVVFGLLHGGNAGVSPLALLNLILFGAFAGIYFVKRGNIWGIAAFHTIWNFAQGNLYGIKVSGMNMGDSILASTMNENQPLVNGGEFGLEGGVAVTIVLALGIIILSLLKPQDVKE